MINKKEIIDAFLYRHACKVFDEKKIISDDDIAFILETARLSPSSFGFEPWHFVVVQNKELRTKLKEGAWGATEKLDTASHFILGLTHKSFFTKYDSPYIREFMENIQEFPEDVIQFRSEAFKNFQKDDFDLNTERTLFDWASKQCYIPLANMLTVSAMIGIDSCPIEGFKQKVTEKILKEELDIDTEKYGLSYMVAFGYRVNDPRAKTRRLLDDIVTWKR
ncbi:MAG: NAD(P)H-dependent oxidoreductase [Pseudomonadota bacterium]|nr:NAD(P)H-dependent oxidoreductase [Pseudomonadota bacterium]